MSQKFYIADWHYSHANVIVYDNRPFKNVDEMNAVLIANWNNAVSKDDTVYILGDMFWCKDDEAIQVLDRLNGHKILVRGNHDSDSSKFTKAFDRVVDYLEIKDEGRHVVLCHYPIPCFKNHVKDWYHLYGHVHVSFEANMMEHQKYLMEELYLKPCNMFNVGAMKAYMDYTPRTLDEILMLSDGRKEVAE